MTIWQEPTAGPGGPVGVGSGWGSSGAWLVAFGVLVLLAGLWWRIVRPSRRRRRDRGAELALRRYELRGASPDRRWRRRPGRDGAGRPPGEEVGEVREA